MALRVKTTGNEEVDRLFRKSNQESELGSLAIADGDKQAAEKHFETSREYARQAKELYEIYKDGA